uniref:POTRA domain-containing protein n=1 Tax=candidate division WOR-3 bacterium TaxID=2052148 RepID=A0A7C4TCC6_UNCW3
MTSFLIFILLSEPISKITFIGNHAIPNREIRQSILSRVKGEYNEIIVNQDVNRIARIYYNKGFFKTEIQSEVKKREEGVEVIFNIIEGVRPRIKEIRIEDSLKKPAEKIFVIKPNDYFLQERIKESRDKLESFYKEQGYAFAEVTFSLVPDSGYLIFSIKRGEVFYIKDILVKGLKVTNPLVVHREIELKRGERYNQKKVLNSQRRIYSLGFYSAVGVEIVRVSSDSLNLIFSVKELKTRLLNFGAGVSLPIGFLLSFGLEELNLFNLGQRFRIEPSFKIDIKGDWEAKFETRYILPYITPLKLNFSILPFYWYEKSSEFIRKTRGAEFRFSRVYSENIQANISNKYKFVDYESETILPDTIKGVTNSVKFQTMVDYRDEFFNPKRGLYFIPTFEYAGGILGGENNFFRIEIEEKTFFQILEKIVFAQRTKAGVIFQTDGLSIDEEYYLGGQYTLRGYNEKSVGPDSIGDEHYGKILFNSNFEMRTGIFKNWGLVSFLDLGYVDNKIDLSRTEFLKWSLGLGLRYNTPIGPIRCDFGLPMTEEGYGIYFGLYHIF